MRIISTHAGGLANVWLNLVKVLIGLVFVYQQVLSDQLGLTGLLNLNLDVLTLGDVVGATVQSVGTAIRPRDARMNHVHRVSSVGDVIDIPFVPISRNKYDRIQVVVTGIGRKTNGNWILLQAPAPAVSARFYWPERGSGARAIRVAGFTLSDLLCKSDLGQLNMLTATPNQTEVEFRLRYLVRAEYRDRMVDGRFDEALVNYRLPGVAEHGFDMSIVEGQSADLPSDLARAPRIVFHNQSLNIQNRRVKWSGSLRVGVQSEFPGTYTDAAGSNQAFKLRVFGIPNRPPLQIRGDYVGLDNPLNRYTDPYAPRDCYQWSFQLSDYIVDPDGVGPKGPDFGRYRLTLLPQTYTLDKAPGPCPYKVEPFGTNQWRLYRLKTSGQPAVGHTESLVLVARDSEGKEQRIEVRIVS